MRLKIYLPLLFSLFVLSGTAQEEQNDLPCHYEKALKRAKEKMDPYSYDASKKDDLVFKDKETHYEVEVPLFMGEKYRFVFNTSQLPKDIKIEIFNKEAGSWNRKLLFSTDSAEADNGLYVFEPEKSRDMYVNYTTPISEEKLEGCVLFVVGYKIPVFK